MEVAGLKLPTVRPAGTNPGLGQRLPAAAAAARLVFSLADSHRRRGAPQQLHREHGVAAAGVLVDARASGLAGAAGAAQQVQGLLGAAHLSLVRRGHTSSTHGINVKTSAVHKKTSAGDWQDPGQPQPTL
jgi:hypothetical protein